MYFLLLFLTFIKNAPYQNFFETGTFVNAKNTYQKKYTDWILSSSYSSIKGLEKFNRFDFTFGVTQSLDDLFIKHSNDRLMVLKGEYHYSFRIHKNYGNLLIDELKENDWVLISLPFCYDGCKPKDLLKILNECYSKNIPVYIDAAFYFLSFDFELDLTHPAIKEVYFSLSKSLGLGFLRTGIRFSYEGSYTPIVMQNDYNYSNLAYIELGAYLIDLYSADYIVKNYLEQYLNICKNENLIVGNCIHLATTDRKIENHLQKDGVTKVGIWWEL